MDWEIKGGVMVTNCPTYNGYPYGEYFNLFTEL